MTANTMLRAQHMRAVNTARVAGGWGGECNDGEESNTEAKVTGSAGVEKPAQGGKRGKAGGRKTDRRQEKAEAHFQKQTWGKEQKPGKGGRVGNGNKYDSGVGCWNKRNREWNGQR